MAPSLPTLADALATFAVDEGELDARQTLRPSLRTLDDQQRVVLDELVDAQRGGECIAVGEVLGEGGMGIVRLAEQRSLRRAVAVKALRVGQETPANALQLLREALLTGRLEHPNIVPVHDMELTEDGLPQLLLKRIEGRAWSCFFGDDARVQERFDVDDALQWHLRVLVSVCDAVRFAHTQGVVHRDLKPDNVMIGSFGEVYVVDWGLAVALRGEAAAVVPATRRRVVGTPAYMAPEMLEGDADELTDVYLLGGILYELLTGQPPHGTGALDVILEHIRHATVRPPPGAPDELAELCTDALAKDAAARPESVDVFRRRLLAYLDHRGSLRIARDAQHRLQELEQLLASSGADRVQAHTLYSEARFGFQHALRAWPGNWRAASGLRAAIARMVRFELTHGEVAAAEHLLREVGDADAALVADVAEARRVADARERALLSARRQLDPGVGARGRILLAVGLTAAWTGIPLTVWQLGWEPIGSYPAIYSVIALFTLVYAVAVVALRRVVFSTSYNRTAAAYLFFAAFLVFPLTLGSERLGLAPERAVSLEYFLWGALGVMAAFTHSRWFALSSTGYLLGFLLLSGSSEHTFAVMTTCNLLLMVSVLLAWRGGPPAPTGA